MLNMIIEKRPNKNHLYCVKVYAPKEELENLEKQAIEEGLSVSNLIRFLMKRGKKYDKIADKAISAIISKYKE